MLDMRMIHWCDAELKRVGILVYLFVTRDIYFNEEIFVAYGAAYWA